MQHQPTMDEDLSQAPASPVSGISRRAQAGQDDVSMRTALLGGAALLGLAVAVVATAEKRRSRGLRGLLRRWREAREAE